MRLGGSCFPLPAMVVLTAVLHVHMGDANGVRFDHAYSSCIQDNSVYLESAQNMQKLHLNHSNSPSGERQYQIYNDSCIKCRRSKAQTGTSNRTRGCTSPPIHKMSCRYLYGCLKRPSYGREVGQESML
mmetsp:Transcript_22948/g.74828  ORF Transcript_22948/g.74828 Transcript_22948/m.74828 type:complete len:129 (-) Transcript_22948:774-1160(-)